MAAFVLGNGVSRASIDIDHLMTLGPVYGCNALYRTHAPTALVATDRAIATEIQESGYSARHRFYTRRPLPGLGAIAVPKPYFGFSSGPIAVSLAAADSNFTVYLLGFDMGATPQGRFNNVFADTAHYKTSDAAPTFTGNWIKQLITVMRDHSQHQFVRVHGPTTAEIPQFDQIANLAKLPLAEFVQRINKPKDL